MKYNKLISGRFASYSVMDYARSTEKSIALKAAYTKKKESPSKIVKEYGSFCYVMTFTYSETQYITQIIPIEFNYLKFR